MRCLMNVLFTLDYDSYGKIRYEAEKRTIKTVDTQFADKVFVRMAMTSGEFDHMSAYLNDVSRGTGTILSDGEIWISEKKND